MASNNRKYKAFLSSTFTDLKNHRARVIEQASKSGFDLESMEKWTADGDEPKKFSRDRLAGCDVFILLVAFRRGFIPEGEVLSITQLEYEAALSRGLEVLVYQLHYEAKWWAKYDERKDDPALEEWRSDLGKRHLVEYFTDDPCSIDIGNALIRWLAEKEREETEPKNGVTIKWSEDKSPYPGLEWFDEDYAPLFFGRDQEVNELVNKLSKPDGRFLIISGPSGSGKSSLVAAGLYKALIDKGGLPDSKDWKWQRITPAADERGPFASLRAGLRHAFPKLSVTAVDSALAPASGPKAFVTHITPQLNRRQELVLFIDQLEELFTQTSASEEPRLAEARSFLAWLVENSGNPQNRLRVVATIQSEYFGKVADSEGVLQKINEGFHLAIGTISATALREMITQPAKKTGYEFESGLVDKILDEAVKEPGHLPLVAYALKQLFEQRQGRIFTCAVYQAMGGITGAIGTEANKALAKFEQQVEASLDKVFSELVHIGGDRSVTCKRARMSEFTNDKDAEKVVRALAGSDCRVLVIDRDTCGETVDVAHEKLLEAWPRMATWLEDNKSFVDWRDRLRGRVRDWQRNNKDEGTLLPRILLGEAQDWRTRKAAVLTNEETDYIEHSVDAHVQEEEAKQERAEHERAVQAEQQRTERELVQTRRLAEEAAKREDAERARAAATEEARQAQQARAQEAEIAKQRQTWFTLGLLILLLCSCMALWLWYKGYSSDHAGLWVQSVFVSIHQRPKEMMRIEAGTFQMGDVEKLGGPQRNPVHTVTIKKPFELGKYEVTFEEYDRFAIATERPLPDDMGWGRKRHPVINVSWKDAADYAEWLKQETGQPYRLPTESEWEYAARSGTTQEWAGTSDPSQLKDYAVYEENSAGKPEVVDGKNHNGFRLNNMSGNVWEWVNDCWHRTYEEAPLDGSAWLAANAEDCRQHVQRGGSWTSSSETIRASNRTMYPTNYRSVNLGFRLAKDLGP